MCLEDEDAFLMKLSSNSYIGVFKYVILISAYNDGFVNYESSKIIFDKNMKEPHNQMAKNIFNNLHCD